MLATLVSTLLLSQIVAPPIYTKSITKPDGIVQMQTAAQRFTAEGKPDVWLVGVVHIGEKQYYADLVKLLDAQNLVLFEGVKPSAKAPAPPADTRAQTPIYKALSDALGLEFQSTQVNTQRPNWVNSDLSWDDLDKLNKEKNGDKAGAFDQLKQALDPTSAMGKQLVTLLQTATPGLKEGIKMVLVKTVASGKGPELDKGVQEIILEARNQSVMDVFAKTVKAESAPKSVAIFWGAMHMPGLQKSLAGLYGYKPAETKWFHAASADPAKMDATGKMIVDMFEKRADPPKSGGGLTLWRPAIAAMF